LDIGCNAGDVAVHLALNFNVASVTGVDIDPELVRKAEETFVLRASRVRPATADSDRVVDYYPISAILKHGFRPRDSVEKASLAACPPPATLAPESPRVNFVSADWVGSQNPATSGPYDVILALSVVKWIHLEHLDEGLVSFFRKCYLSLVDGGYLVLETQPWQSYEKAVRPHKAPHFKENLERLEYRPETCFDKLLQEQGLILCETSDALPRRISVYHKQSGQREHVRGEGDLGNQTISA
jgi:7SK snRNA methylphosphate capping enzyme